MTARGSGGLKYTFFEDTQLAVSNKKCLPQLCILLPRIFHHDRAQPDAQSEAAWLLLHPLDHILPPLAKVLSEVDLQVAIENVEIVISNNVLSGCKSRYMKTIQNVMFPRTPHSPFIGQIPDSPS